MRPVGAAFGFVQRLGKSGLSAADQERLAAELARVRVEVAKAIQEAAKNRELSAEQRQVLILEQKRALAELTREQRSSRSGRGPPGRHTPAAGEPPTAPFPEDVSCSVTSGEQVVGELKAKIKAKDLLQSVLAQTDRSQGEIPFALDDQNTLFVAASADGEKLRPLPAIAALKSGAAGAGDGAAATTGCW